MLLVVCSVVDAEMVHIFLFVLAYSVYVAHGFFAIVLLMFPMILLICLLLLPLLWLVQLLWLLQIVAARDSVCCSVVVDADIIHTAISVLHMPVLLLCSCCSCWWYCYFALAVIASVDAHVG
jgi:hypothetical protein